MTLPRQGRFALHVACGTVRGEYPLFTQDCPCAPVRRRPGIFGRLIDLCLVCAHGFTISGTAYSWLACRSCRSVETALRDVVGHPVLPLSRVSCSNAFRDVDGTLLPFRPLSTDLWPVAADLPAHGRRVARRLAQGLESEELPLELWEVLHPESIDRSVEVYEELLRRPLPAEVLRVLRA